MKTITTCLLILVCFAFVHGQSAPAYKSSFAAIVVSNVDNSSRWYQSVLKLSMKEELRDNAGDAYKITILTSDGFEMELLELKGSVSRSSALAGKSTGTEMQGLFKIGFRVNNMDEWLKHLESVNVNVPQIWTDPKTGLRNFLINDLDGNFIQFFEN